MGPSQDAEQPTASRRQIPQLVKAGERAECRVLEQILGVSLVPAAEPERRPKQRVQMLGEDFFECPGGSGASRQSELLAEAIGYWLLAMWFAKTLHHSLLLRHSRRSNPSLRTGSAKGLPPFDSTNFPAAPNLRPPRVAHGVKKWVV